MDSTLDIFISMPSSCLPFNSLQNPYVTQLTHSIPLNLCSWRGETNYREVGDDALCVHVSNVDTEIAELPCQ